MMTEDDRAAAGLLEWAVCEALLRLPPVLPPNARTTEIPLMQLLVKLARPRSYVQLGVGEGAAFVAVCSAARAYQTETICFGIDDWPDEPETLREMLGTCYPPARLLRGGPREYAAWFEDGSVDAVYLADAAAIEGVGALEPWLPKLSSAAVVAVAGIRGGGGAARIWEELAARYPVRLEPGVAAGLGVVVAGDEVPSALERLVWTCGREPNYLALIGALGDQAAALLPERDHGRANEGAARVLGELRAHADGELARLCERVMRRDYGEAFTVGAVFRAFLRREPEPIEAEYWETLAAHGTPLHELVAGFDLLPEFRAASDLRRLLTFQELNRALDAADRSAGAAAC